MVGWGDGLLFKWKGTNSYPQHICKKAGLAVHAHNPSAWEAERNISRSFSGQVVWLSDLVEKTVANKETVMLLLISVAVINP